jgi:hypothetical protein
LAFGENQGPFFFFKTLARCPTKPFKEVYLKHRTMKAAEIKNVSRSQILKVSLLVSVMVSISKTLFIYRMIDTGKWIFRGN